MSTSSIRKASLIASRLSSLYNVSAKAEDLLSATTEMPDVRLLLLHYRGFVLNDVTYYHIPAREEDYTHEGKGITTSLWRRWEIPDISFFLLKSDVTELPGCLPDSTVYHEGRLVSFKKYIPIFLKEVANILSVIIDWNDLSDISIEILQSLFTPAALFQMYPVGEHFTNVWWHLFGSLVKINYSRYYDTPSLRSFLSESLFILSKERHLGDTDIAVILHSALSILSQEDLPNVLYGSDIGSYIKSVRSYTDLFVVPDVGRIQGLRIVVCTKDDTIILTSQKEEYLSDDSQSSLISTKRREHVRADAERMVSRLLI